MVKKDAGKRCNLGSDWICNVSLTLGLFQSARADYKILDSRAQKINDELEEAKKLRKEAQTVLAEFQKKNKEAEKTAKTIIEDAKKNCKKL